MRQTHLLLKYFLFVVCICGENGLAKPLQVQPIASFYDVALGMTKEQVLSSLAEGYQLDRPSVPM